jgi:sec-independent protein translocase protein TatA
MLRDAALPARLLSAESVDRRPHLNRFGGSPMFEGLMQPMHLLVILFIALLLFGPNKLSELGKGLGQGIKNFKDAVNEGKSEQPAAAKKDVPPQAPQA